MWDGTSTCLAQPDQTTVNKERRVWIVQGNLDEAPGATYAHSRRVNSNKSYCIIYKHGDWAHGVYDEVTLCVCVRACVERTDVVEYGGYS